VTLSSVSRAWTSKTKSSGFANQAALPCFNFRILKLPRLCEFCDALDAPESCRKDFGQLRRRVIEPAVAELQAKNGVEVEWKGVKVGGRKVSGLEFTFKPSQQGNLF